jgi:hypothetical protein
MRFRGQVSTDCWMSDHPVFSVVPFKPVYREDHDGDGSYYALNALPAGRFLYDCLHHLEKMKEHLKTFSPDISDGSPLLTAIWGQNFEGIELLLDVGCNVTVRGNEPFFQLAATGYSRFDIASDTSFGSSWGITVEKRIEDWHSTLNTIEKLLERFLELGATIPEEAIPKLLWSPTLLRKCPPIPTVFEEIDYLQEKLSKYNLTERLEESLKIVSERPIWKFRTINWKIGDRVVQFEEIPWSRELYSQITVDGLHLHEAHFGAQIIAFEKGRIVSLGSEYKEIWSFIPGWVITECSSDRTLVDAILLYEA